MASKISLLATAACRRMFLPLLLATTAAAHAQSVSAVSLNPTTQIGGSSVAGQVTLTQAAPTGGFKVELSSSDKHATLDHHVTVSAGNTTATFNIDTRPVKALTAVTITATGGGASATASLSILSPQLFLMVISPTSVVGGAKAAGHAYLDGPAPEGGIDVALSSDSTSAIVHSTLHIHEGDLSGEFRVATKPVTTSTTAHIMGAQGFLTVSTPLVILPPSPLSLNVSPETVRGGESAIGKVKLNAPAPTGGTTVTLSSNQPFATVPATITIDAGDTTAFFKVKTMPVATTGAATISATGNGVTQTAALTVEAPALREIRIDCDRLEGGNSTDAFVVLHGVAPTGGLVVTLSSNSAVATVPASVTVQAGSDHAKFTIATTAVTSNTTVTITATLGAASVSHKITVTK